MAIFRSVYKGKAKIWNTQEMQREFSFLNF